MPAPSQLDTAEIPNRALDPVDLLHRAVLVVDALDSQHRTPDVRQERLDVPGSEVRVQPDVVPAPECAVDVGVTACKPRAQIAVEVRAPSLCNAGEAVGFDEHVGGERHHGRYRTP